MFRSFPSWGPLFFALLILVVGVIPLFYYALYRNQGTLRFARPLRTLSFFTAIPLGAMMLIQFPQWIASLIRYGALISDINWRLGSTSLIALARAPQTMVQLSTLLSEFSGATSFLVLLVIVRQGDGGSFIDTDVPPSRLLRTTTKIMLITCALWVLFSIARFVLIPFAFSKIRDIALWGGRDVHLWTLMRPAIEMLLWSACFFITPYVVYNSWLRRDEAAPGH